jgi:flagellar biosynthetic protein FliR
VFSVAWILQGFSVFLLIFCRITAFFVVAPVFSHRTVPAQFKIGLGFVVSVLVFLVYGMKQTVVPDAEYILFVIREVLVGLLLGFTAAMFFAAVQTAGAFIDLQMGFAMANVFDPATGANSPIMGQFKYIVLTLVFLSMNGHHFLLRALLDSYQWVPLSNRLFQEIYAGGVSGFLVRTFTETFMIALQIAAPLIVAMFLTDVGLGFLARTAPQYNVFVIGIPLKILIGLIMLMLLMPAFSSLFEQLFVHLFDSLERLFGLLQGRAQSG